MADELMHYGVKGMKWGVRKDRSRHDAIFRRKAQERVKVKTTAVPGKKVQAEGGTGQTASPDAIRAAVIKQKAKKSTTDSLSNKELKELVTRLNLEQQYNSLDPAPESLAKRIFKGSGELTKQYGPEIAINKINQTYGDSDDPEVQRAVQAANIVGRVLKDQMKSGKKKKK